MTEAETNLPRRDSVDPPNDGVDDIEKSHVDASHDENAAAHDSYIPQDDEQYVVTFKTWIVVGVSDNHRTSTRLT